MTFPRPDFYGTLPSSSVTLADGAAVHEETLDIDLGLNARAASSIAAAQPIATVDGLSRLYYVGHSALSVLKDAAAKDAIQQD